MRKTDLAAEIRRALDSTHYYESNAASFTIKIARSTTQSVAHVTDNLLTALPALIKHIPRRWENVRSICLKTRDSLALPVYNSLSEMEMVSAVGEDSTEVETVVVLAADGEQPPLLTDVQKKRMERQLVQEESKREVQSIRFECTAHSLAG